MFEIIVDPEKLHQQANILAKSAKQLDSISDELGSIANTINPSDYDGKLKKMVTGILADAKTDTVNLSKDITELQGALQKKADDFENANKVIRGTMENIKVSISKFTGSVSGFWGSVASIFVGKNTSSIELGAQEKLDDHVTVYSPGEENTATNQPETDNVHTEVKLVTTRTESVEVPEEVLGDDGEPANDCVEFVNGVWAKEGQTRPKGFTSEEGHPYHPEFGEKIEYEGHTVSKVPEAGALMTESKNPDGGIDYAHSSYVSSVKYDKDDFPTSFTVVQRNWGEDKTKTVPTTFSWDTETKTYISENGKRYPNAFIYQKK
jgi:hypothetical protein